MDSEFQKATILVVDDTPDNITVISGILRPEYRVKAARNGIQALKIALIEPQPDLILLDIMMPGIDGYEVCQQLKADLRTRSIPVIFVTAKSEIEDERQGLELGAADYITKPINPSIVLARVRTQLALYDQNRQLETKVRQRTSELRTTRLEIIRRLGRAAEFKDNQTGLHVIRMSYYTRLIAESLGVGEVWSDLLFNAAPMHDIGKIGIPDEILLKPGKLNPREWTVMCRHPQYGAEIIGEHDSELMRTSRDIALNHHEKWDGTGYPNGKRGEEIPIAARIVALADVFDALTTVRPYKEAWSVDDAVRYIDERSGKHFDPGLVPLFHQLLPEILEIKSKYEETTAGTGSLA
ncbi:MAG: two-component system response regulator [Gammaproteobacteria bacterium]|nr:two-component system response regulator [Gammaproteobacteria bacterium]